MHDDRDHDDRDAGAGAEPARQDAPEAVLAAPQQLLEIGRLRPARAGPGRRHGCRPRAAAARPLPPGPPPAAPEHRRRPFRRREARCPRDHRPHSARSCNSTRFARPRQCRRPKARYPAACRHATPAPRGSARLATRRCCQVPPNRATIARHSAPSGARAANAAVTERQILDALGRVRDPDKGGDIVSLGMVSGLVVRDGNVAFAIEVEPERGPRLEPLRKAAEKAVEALPGVLSVTAVLTAEARPRGRAAPAGRAGPRAAPGQRAPAAQERARAGVAGDRRRRLGQRRGRQIDGGRQSGAGDAGQRAAGRGARRRHLRPLDAAHAGDLRPAPLARRQDPACRWRITASNACRWGFSCPRTRR